MLSILYIIINILRSSLATALEMMLLLTWMLIRLPLLIMYYIYIFPPYYVYCKGLQLCDLILSVFCRKSKKIRIFLDHCIAIVQIIEGLWIKLRHAQYNEVVSFMGMTITEVCAHNNQI